MIRNRLLLTSLLVTGAMAVVLWFAPATPDTSIPTSTVRVFDQTTEHATVPVSDVPGTDPEARGGEDEYLEMKYVLMGGLE